MHTNQVNNWNYGLIMNTRHPLHIVSLASVLRTPWTFVVLAFILLPRCGPAAECEPGTAVLRTTSSLELRDERGFVARQQRQPQLPAANNTWQQFRTLASCQSRTEQAADISSGTWTQKESAETGTSRKVNTRAPRAIVYSPRVLAPTVADAYSMRTFARFHRWRGLEKDGKAYEIYRYLADKETGLFHMNVVAEGNDGLSEFVQIRDPVKIINVYGYAYCGILGPTMAGVCEQVGLGPSRTLVLPAWNHVAAETFYNGDWHYLDLDVRAVFRRRGGTLASLEDARQDASLWRERGPLFFPNDPLDSTRAVYEKTTVQTYHDFHQTGHTMDYVLRPGESFTRWWEPQGGRWQHLPQYNRIKWLSELIEAPPRGPKPNHRHFTVHNHGNGKFVYQPKLIPEYSDFANGVHDFSNLVLSENGLTVESDEESGWAVFEVRSPYIVVPQVRSLDRTDDDRQASVVELEGRKLSLSISIDNGLTWEPLTGSLHGARTSKRAKRTALKLI